MSDTPRLDALEAELGNHIGDSYKETVAYYQLAYELERELNSAKAELEHEKEKVRKLREFLVEADVADALYEVGSKAWSFEVAKILEETECLSI